MKLTNRQQEKLKFEFECYLAEGYDQEEAMKLASDVLKAEIERKKNFEDLAKKYGFEF